MSHRTLDACGGALVEVARFLARNSSRRSFIARLGGALIGTFAFPVLPMDRRDSEDAGSTGKKAKTFHATAQTKDDTQCNYWRYCAIGGNLCTCCGGTLSSCPPGTFEPPTGWVGSCINPEDGQAYLIMYRDCCGKEICGRCRCSSSEGEMPAYRPQSSDAPVWCFGTDQMAYHCTQATLLGKS